MLSPKELRTRVDALGWFHPIDLPDLAGKTVLDIGAWDGYYSFQAERLGASGVVALDHYVWGVDMAAGQLH